MCKRLKRLLGGQLVKPGVKEFEWESGLHPKKEKKEKKAPKQATLPYLLG